MSERNDNSGFIFVIAIVGALAYVIAVFAFMFLMFIAFLGTILCAFALEKPLRLGKWTLTTEEAQGFIARGVLGAVFLPLFLVFCAVVFGVRLTGEALSWAAATGYMMGSVGVVMLMAEDEPAVSAPDLLPPAIDVTPPAHRGPSARIAPPPGKPPFRFASWNDEEELR